MALLQHQRQPSAIDREDGLPIIGVSERSNGQIAQLEGPANGVLEDEKRLRERCWIDTVFFRQPGCEDLEGETLPCVSLQNRIAHASKRFSK